MKKCTKCGYKNADRAQFCDLCTRKFEPTQRYDAGPLGPGSPLSAGVALGALATAAPPSVRTATAEPRTAGFELEGVVFTDAAPAVDPKLATERRYFVLPTGDLHRLPRGMKLEIGREESSDIKLATPKVSRHHAEIRWFGSQCCICDLGSQNGTAVNKEKLSPNGKRELKDRDEVDVGGVPLTFRVLPPGVPETELVRQAASTEADFAAPTKREDLVGQVRLVSLESVLRRLEELNASGTLSVESDGTKGTLLLKDGKAAFGTFRDLRGDAAVQTISRLKDGRFRFEQSD